MHKKILVTVLSLMILGKIAAAFRQHQQNEDNLTKDSSPIENKD
jgi:hypothetical protein